MTPATYGPRAESGTAPDAAADVDAQAFAPRRLPTVAVVLAGGSGSRVGLDVPKQLLKVAGRTIIEHSVAALHDCDVVDEIVVVMTPAFVPEVRALLVRPELPKVTRVLPGGSDRNASTRVALDALGEQECNVLFHDAVRPLLSQRVITDCVQALQSYEAVDVAIPSADTIVQVDDDEHVLEIPDRSHLRRGQTPQGFRLSVIRRAYEIAAGDPTLRATDDCGVLLHCLPEVPIHVVRGDEHNMKVTYPVDLFIADKLFQLSSHRAAPATPEQHAERLGGKTMVVFGGSYGIGADVDRLATAAGCQVFSFSRSTTGTHVERSEDVAAALAKVHAETGAIDMVVLTAAVLERGPLAEMDDATVERQLQVNYLAPVTVARLAQPYLRGSRGHLVFFTSSSYTRGRAGYSMYSSTKAAVVNLTQALADEWAADGISVNVINPERTRTPMRLHAFGEEPEDSLLDSEFVAATTLDVLVSNLTGQVIDVRRAPTSDRGKQVGLPAGDVIQQVLSEVAEREATSDREAQNRVAGRTA
ncbi:MAG: bifunctional cytidylyltransferase/SDR family oxidoreductase [Actinomycetota bacterium]|nr:bifunctional cytidylyltransferase/SDR family oxidoreductase [Actinomycetota bacterium]